MGDEPAVYLEDGRWVYRASAVGGCVRALYLARTGIRAQSPPPFVQRIYDAGNRGEERVLTMLAQQGWTVGDCQKRVELNVGNAAMIRGHVDGAGYRGSEPELLVEIKCLGETYREGWARDKWDAFPHYRTQLAAMMYAGGWRRALFVLGQKNSAGDVTGIDIYHIDEPPMALADVKRRVMQVEKAAKEGKEPGCDREQTPFCPYAFIHDEDLPSEGTVELEEAAMWWLWGQALEQEGKQIRSDAGCVMNVWFDDNNLKGGKAATETVVVKDVIQRRQGTVDLKQLAADLDVDVHKWRKPGREVRYQKVDTRKAT